jgi:hypothetical protein
MFLTYFFLIVLGKDTTYRGGLKIGGHYNCAGDKSEGEIATFEFGGTEPNSY